MTLLYFEKDAGIALASLFLIYGLFRRNPAATDDYKAIFHETESFQAFIQSFLESFYIGSSSDMLKNLF